MRPLTEEETRVFLEKLSKYIGRNTTYLIERADEPHVFRLHKDRVYYVKESVVKRSENIPRDKLSTVGVCFGKFTKTMKFRLHITALDYLAQFARCKIWVKGTAEMSFLYGNHILKAHVAKMTEDAAEHQGAVIYNLADVPLGFAVTAKSAAMTVKLDPTAIVAFHQADVGEYLRDEDTLII